MLTADLGAGPLLSWAGPIEAVAVEGRTRGGQVSYAFGGLRGRLSGPVIGHITLGVRSYSLVSPRPRYLKSWVADVYGVVLIVRRNLQFIIIHYNKAQPNSARLEQVQMVQSARTNLPVRHRDLRML